MLAKSIKGTTYQIVKILCESLVQCFYLLLEEDVVLGDDVDGFD